MDSELRDLERLITPPKTARVTEVLTSDRLALSLLGAAAPRPPGPAPEGPRDGGVGPVDAGDVGLGSPRREGRPVRHARDAALEAALAVAEDRPVSIKGPTPLEIRDVPPEPQAEVVHTCLVVLLFVEVTDTRQRSLTSILPSWGPCHPTSLPLDGHVA